MKKRLNPRRVAFEDVTPMVTRTESLRGRTEIDVMQSLARLVDATRDLEHARRELREARAELQALVNPLLQDDI